MLRMGFAPCGEPALSIWPRQSIAMDPRPSRAALRPCQPCPRGHATPTGECAGRAATDTDPGRTRIGERTKARRGATTRRPPWPPLPRSRRTCSSCSPAAEHVRLSRSSQPVPAATTTMAPHSARSVRPNRIDRFFGDFKSLVIRNPRRIGQLKKPGSSKFGLA
jgi:hypothetical protein